MILLYWDDDRVRLQLPVQDNYLGLLTSTQPGHPSAMSISQWAVMLCGWKVKTDTARVWWQLQFLVKHVGLSYLSALQVR